MTTKAITNDINTATSARRPILYGDHTTQRRTFSRRAFLKFLVSTNGQDDKTSDKARIPKNRRLRIATFTTVAALGAGTFPAIATAAEQGPNNRPEMSELVDAYEQHQPFRGVANDGLPVTLDEGLQLGNVVVYPGDSGSGVLVDGYVDYGTTNDGAHIVAASDGQEMDRFGIIINEGDPNQYAFDVEIPGGATVNHEASGAIKVTGPDNTTTTLAPALAVDADGTVLEASYRINDGQLKVIVDLEGAQFPVFVDPVSASYWWGTQTWYSRADVRQSASWYAVIGVAVRACKAMGVAAGVCERIVNSYVGWIYNTWMDAKNNNQCLWMKMTWTGQVIGISRYACNWG